MAGMTAGNTDNYKLYIDFGNGMGSAQYIIMYKVPGDTAVASGFRTVGEGAGTITIGDDGSGSGLSGSVVWDGTLVQDASGGLGTTYLYCPVGCS
jgi:hypothetical protein